MKQEYVDQADKKKIIGILTVLFPEAKIYLFGSRARGTASAFSDIDIALDTKTIIDRLRMSEAIAMLNESNIPYKIDVVDVYEVPEAMRSQIYKEGILWKT